MKISFPLFVLLAGATGCSFAARSPDMYRDDTQALLETRGEQIRSCYDTALKTSPNLSGRVTVLFTVQTETGNLSEIAADPAGTTAPEALTRCVIDSLQGLALSPPDERLGKAAFIYDFTPTPTPTPTPAPAPAPAPAG